MIPVEFPVLFLTTLSLFNIIHGQAGKLGAQVQISQSALDFGSRVAVDVLTKNLDQQTIPDLSGQAKVVVGKVDYSISGVKIADFTKPSTTVTVNPGSGLTWTFWNAGIKFDGRWSYRYKLWFVNIRDSGTFDVSVSGASATITVTMERLSNGNPSIRMVSCSCTIAKVDVKFRGGAAWLYNLFSGFVERPLKNEFQIQVCKAAEKTINGNAAALFATFETSVTLKKDYVLDYSLAANPMFAAGFIQTFHKGEVFHLPDRTPAPFSGPSITTPPPTRMLTVYITEYLPNTLGRVLHINNVFTYTLIKADVPKSFQTYFDPVCAEDVTCFDTLFRGAAKNYPDASIELNMATTVAPTLTINLQNIVGNITGRVQVDARLSNGEKRNLISLGVTLIVKVTPSVLGNRILVTVTEIIPRIKVESSPIGTNIPEDSVNELITMAINAFIMPKLKEVGTGQGIKLPSVDDANFIEPTINLMTGALKVSTDLSYTPPGRR